MNTQFNFATKHYNITEKNSKTKLKTYTLLAVKSFILNPIMNRAEVSTLFHLKGDVYWAVILNLESFVAICTKGTHATVRGYVVRTIVLPLALKRLDAFNTRGVP